MKKGGRAKEFELAIQWLVDAGLVYKITKVSKPELPLKFMKIYRRLSYIYAIAG